jgi:hypothetical protein
MEGKFSKPEPGIRPEFSWALLIFSIMIKNG